MSEREDQNERRGPFWLPLFVLVSSTGVCGLMVYGWIHWIMAEAPWFFSLPSWPVTAIMVQSLAAAWLALLNLKR